ncbi:Bromodomain-containing protein [Suillus decipiens]|nr:Bromodomain-containing protein [Suillus decipiens]
MPRIAHESASSIVTGESYSSYHSSTRADDNVLGIPTLIFRLKIVLIVLARPRLSTVTSSITSRERAKKPCMLVRELDIEDKVIQADHFDESTQEEHEEFLRSIFEADQEGENEEAGEVNEMLARNEKKWRFYSVDLQRGQDALDAWRAWAMAVEDGEDLQGLIDHARGKKERWAANKLFKETDSPDNGEERDMKQRRGDVSRAIRDKMKKAFNVVFKAVFTCEDKDGRKRCELFRGLPDRREYPDYYELITHPIALSTLRKREDWKVMFDDARTYNQEGSWVYTDAEEMEKVFHSTLERLTARTGLPGTSPALGGPSSFAAYDSALTHMDEDGLNEADLEVLVANR